MGSDFWQSFGVFLCKKVQLIWKHSVCPDDPGVSLCPQRGSLHSRPLALSSPLKRGRGLGTYLLPFHED